MILNVKNDTGNSIQFCCGEKEYELKPQESVAVEVKDQDFMYFDGVKDM